uniref:Proline-rich protein 18-like n=1 Tax=Scleropages formosus TaxID=113540 RepID=A0A8C9W0C5_SCLFO
MSFNFKTTPFLVDYGSHTHIKLLDSSWSLKIASKLPIHRPAAKLQVEGRSVCSASPKILTNSQDNRSGLTRNGWSRSCWTSNGDEEGEQFSLNLSSEATEIIQKRILEKQMALDRGFRLDHSSKRSPESRSKVRCNRTETVNDIRTAVKISLLNDRYKYDDEEYEDESGGIDESVLIKCQEWLKGVERSWPLGKAAAFRHRGCRFEYHCLL